MKGKLLIVGFVMISVGLVLLVYSDPVLNAIVIGQGTSTSTTTTAVSSSSGASGFPGGFGGGFALSSGTGDTGSRTTPSSILSSDSIAENSAGLGLAAIGIIFAIAGSRTRMS